MKEWEVSQKQSGISLQAFLKEQLGADFSGKQIKRLVDSGKCLLNGKAERFASRLVGKGDKVELIGFQNEKKSSSTKSNASNRVLYFDDDLIAYDKPFGVSSDSKIILDTLQKQFDQLILLHRLDKDTTGILLFARHEAAAKTIESLFKKRLIKKIYLAIVHGIPAKPSGVIENFLGKLHSYHGQTIWGRVSEEKGLPAKTSWKIKKRGNEASLLVCYPETGRTHQIRVHLSEIGHPILGDHQYGGATAGKYHPQRVLLHAYEILFEHPTTKRMIHIKSPLPEDFAGAMKSLWGHLE